jgi:uroporphyrinogen III methyltransferase/synthase
MSTQGQVYIIGAGPGDPGLISARGARLLALADVVIYDQAVEGVLRWARNDSERIAAGAPAERETAQDAISMLLAEKARDGFVVARLKWGDAFVFDSGGKEAMFLHEQGIPFEVVPGIPLAIGASAYAGVPLTYPGSGDVVVLLRGYEGEVDKTPDVDWSAVATLDGTLVCYAGGRLVPRVLGKLLSHGMPPSRPAVLIYEGTQPAQRTITGTVETLAAATDEDDGDGPAILIVGEVVGLRDHLRWFDERPLFGRRIVVTRSSEQARDLVENLESLGARAIEAPTFRLAPPEDPEALDRAAASIGQYGWVVFESANAVVRLLSVLTRGPQDIRAFGGVKVCAIGASTAERLLTYGIKPDVEVAEAGSGHVGDALEAHGRIADQKVLVVRPDHARDVLPEDLTQRGALVTDLIAYRTDPVASDAPEVQHLYRMLLDGNIDAVTFTSPTAVSRFVELIGEDQAADLLRRTVVAAIGPVTAAAADAVGIAPTVIATTYTIDGLVAAILQHFKNAA